MSSTSSPAESAGVNHVQALAELAVLFAANMQPGQIVAIASEPGKEELARAIAEVAYAEGALFVDLSVFDIYFKRARALHADPATLKFVPPWLGARTLALGEHRCARIWLSGPTDPDALEGIDPARLGVDMLPWTPESMKVIDSETTNWTAIPCPTRSWATLVHPELEPDEAESRLWTEVAHICRLDEPQPVEAWRERLDGLTATTQKLDELRLDAIRYHGPGTDLTVGLLPSSHWCAARFKTVDGIEHVPNIPTEEVFITPDPARADGFVTATKPLFVSGTTIRGLRMRFEGGRAVQVDADEGADVLRGITEQDDGSTRLGELALVDREGRIGPLETVFYDTLIDENAASHIALGSGYEHGVQDPHDRERVNNSGIHVDFMIGSNTVTATGICADGREVPLLHDGNWQL